jgi:hypothetical protein
MGQATSEKAPAAGAAAAGTDDTAHPTTTTLFLHSSGGSSSSKCLLSGVSPTDVRQVSLIHHGSTTTQPPSFIIKEEFKKVKEEEPDSALEEEEEEPDHLDGSSTASSVSEEPRQQQETDVPPTSSILETMTSPDTQQQMTGGGAPLLQPRECEDSCAAQIFSPQNPVNSQSSEEDTRWTKKKINVSEPQPTATKNNDDAEIVLEPHELATIILNDGEWKEYLKLAALEWQEEIFVEAMDLETIELSGDFRDYMTKAALIYYQSVRGMDHSNSGSSTSGEQVILGPAHHRPRIFIPNSLLSSVHESTDDAYSIHSNEIMVGPQNLEPIELHHGSMRDYMKKAALAYFESTRSVHDLMADISAQSNTTAAADDDNATRRRDGDDIDINVKPQQLAAIELKGDLRQYMKKAALAYCESLRATKHKNAFGMMDVSAQSNTTRYGEEVDESNHHHQCPMRMEINVSPRESEAIELTRDLREYMKRAALAYCESLRGSDAASNSFMSDVSARSNQAMGGGEPVAFHSQREITVEPWPSETVVLDGDLREYMKRAALAYCDSLRSADAFMADVSARSTVSVQRDDDGNFLEIELGPRESETVVLSGDLREYMSRAALAYYESTRLSSSGRSSAFMVDISARSNASGLREGDHICHNKMEIKVEPRESETVVLSGDLQEYMKRAALAYYESVQDFKEEMNKSINAQEEIRADAMAQPRESEAIALSEDMLEFMEKAAQDFLESVEDMGKQTGGGIMDVSASSHLFDEGGMEQDASLVCLREELAQSDHSFGAPNDGSGEKEIMVQPQESERGVVSGDLYDYVNKADVACYESLRETNQEVSAPDVNNNRSTPASVTGTGIKAILLGDEEVTEHDNDDSVASLLEEVDNAQRSFELQYSMCSTRSDDVTVPANNTKLYSHSSSALSLMESEDGVEVPLEAASAPATEQEGQDQVHGAMSHQSCASENDLSLDEVSGNSHEDDAAPQSPLRKNAHPSASLSNLPDNTQLHRPRQKSKSCPTISESGIIHVDQLPSRPETRNARSPSFLASLLHSFSSNHSALSAAANSLFCVDCGRSLKSCYCEAHIEDDWRHSQRIESVYLIKVGTIVSDPTAKFLLVKTHTKHGHKKRPNPGFAGTNVNPFVVPKQPTGAKLSERTGQQGSFLSALEEQNRSSPTGLVPQPPESLEDFGSDSDESSPLGELEPLEVLKIGKTIGDHSGDGMFE